MRDIMTGWCELDHSLPEQADQRLLFYNKHLDIYVVNSMDGLELDFKRFRHSFAHIVDNCEEEEDLRTWVNQRYRFTHYHELPDGP
jgi:hypothetical protein